MCKEQKTKCNTIRSFYTSHCFQVFYCMCENNVKKIMCREKKKKTLKPFLICQCLGAMQNQWSTLLMSTDRNYSVTNCWKLIMLNSL